MRMSMSLRAHVLTPMLTALCLASAARPVSAADATFTVNIPDRYPKLPIAAVRITIETSASSATSSLVIGSSTFSPSTIPQISGADFVTFRQMGTNNVEILLVLNSNMKKELDNSINYCQATASLPQDRSMTLTTPGTMTGYRLTGYTVPSSFECKKCPSGRRVSTTPVSWKAGQEPPGTNLGRHPLDVMLVLDRSGSMGSPPMGGSGSKMSILQWAVGQFIDTWKSEASAVSDDRLAVVWFESGVIVGSSFVKRSVVGGWDGIKTGVNAQVIAGSTALGDGVSKAIDMWATDPNRNDGTIVLMTNGMQNSGHQIRPGNLVSPDLGSPDLACFDLSTSQYALLRSLCVTTQAIGVGAPATVQSGLLNSIAEQTGGSKDINLGNTMDFSFLASLVNVLKGNTMSVLGQFEETMAAASVASAARSIELDGSVRQAIAVVAWRNREAKFDLEIRAPDGTPVKPATRLDEPLYTVQTVALPSSGPPGAWSFTVVRKHPPGHDMPYHVSFYTVEGRLDYRVSFGNANHRAGAPVDLLVEVNYDGKPLLGLGGAIAARVAGPAAALGTALHDQSVPGSVLTTDPPGLSTEGPGTPGAAYQRKVHHLLTTTPLLADITPRNLPPPLTLRDDGQGADAKAKDGVYSARFTNTTTPGQYLFDVDIEFDTPSTGKIRRKERLETIIRIKPDGDSTVMTVSGAPGTTRTFEIEPKDALGQYLGPGFGDFIYVKGPGILVTSVTDPQETGKYIVAVSGVAANADPNVTIGVDGVDVYAGPASEVGRPKRRAALFLGLGANVPHGTFDTTYDGNFSLQAGAEYMLTKQVSVEGVFGYDRFSNTPDLKVVHLSARGKVYASLANPRIAVFAGVGAYFFDPGDTHVGVNAGAVAEFKIAPQWSVEATYTLHNVSTPSSASRFSAIQGGVRYRF
jgi:hypothetical protein